MTDLFIYDINRKLIGSNKIDIVIYNVTMDAAKASVVNLLRKEYKLNPKDFKITLNKAFGEDKYSINLIIKDTGDSRDIFLKNLLC